MAPSELPPVEAWVGSSASETVTLANSGEVAIAFTVSIVGSDAWSVMGPSALGPGQSAELVLIYAPQEAGAHPAWLRIETQRGGAPALELHLMGRGLRRCLAVDRDGLNFSTIGEPELLLVSNCGDGPLTGLAVSLDPADAPFEIEASLPPALEPGAHWPVRVRYLGHAGPEQTSQAGASLILTAHDLDPAQVPLYAMECADPVMSISSQEGQMVTPETLLHLSAEVESGSALSWEWQVQQPPGSRSMFIPSSSFPNPTFLANVAGEYHFSLRAWDGEGSPCASPAVLTVLVVPVEAIFVELTWHTPADPDELDQGPSSAQERL